MELKIEELLKFLPASHEPFHDFFICHGVACHYVELDTQDFLF